MNDNQNDGEEQIFDGADHNQQNSSDDGVNSSVKHSSWAENDGTGEFRNPYIELAQVHAKVYVVNPTQFHVSAVICEMCGASGTTDTFFSRSKRFCSVSCSRSYSSNSKKSSILARLQVGLSGVELYTYLFKQ